jgi:FkbM family methyltransferase
LKRLLKSLRSSQLLWQGNAPNKLSRWLNLCRMAIHPSGNILGFYLEYCNGESLRHLYEEIFAREEYFFECDNPNPLILDCGANIGVATVFFKWLYPQSTVVAFEADPTTFRVLQHNIQRNQLRNVSAHNVALWDTDDRISFFVNDRHPGSLLMSVKQNRTLGTEIKVEARRLSQYINVPVDLLKVDLEGSEDRVISDLLLSGKLGLVRQMILEYHHHIPGEAPGLGNFLAILEQSGWNYQLHSWFSPLSARDIFQDVMIYAYR